MIVDKVVNRSFPDFHVNYNFKDTILYALGIGFGAEPLDAKHLQYLYEDGLVAAPTYANVLGHPGFWARDPEYGIDWKKLLHAEQRLTLHRPLPATGEIIGRTDIMGLEDKGEGKGAMLHQRKKVIAAASGETIASVVTTLMLRGDGGCGNHGENPAPLEALPEGEPDKSIEVQTEEIAPLIYRLSGDLNPLHIDPAVAKTAGYAILRAYCDFDASRLKSMVLRFSRPVMPGDKIRFDFWQPKPGLLGFRAVVVERNEVVLDRCTAEIA